jgi:hypothetical protein
MGLVTVAEVILAIVLGAGTRSRWVNNIKMDLTEIGMGYYRLD